VVRQRQRRRRLARQKYERQNVRREAQARRSRTVSIVVFSILGVVGVVAAVLFIAQIVDQGEDDKNPTPDSTSVTPLDPNQLPSDTGTTGDGQPTESAPTPTTPSETQGN
jgi:peptidyl-prolyl cis-trans isomerase B (cyclophilin B)